MNIIVICTHENPELLQFLKQNNHIEIPKCYSTTGSWSGNFVSILSSTFPSHHQVCSENDTPGIHIVTLPNLLTSEGFDSYFVGEQRYHTLAQNMGFNHLKNYESLKNSNSELELDKKNLWFFNYENESSHQQSIQARIEDIKTKSDNLILLLLHPHKKSPFSSLFIISNQIQERKYIQSMISYVDLLPSILGYLRIKKPSPIIGKDFHTNWFSTGKIKQDNMRNAALYEEINGSKTIFTEKYKISIPLKGDLGEIYNLESDPQNQHNLWNDSTFTAQKQELLLLFLWTQLDKEVMPMPRIAGA